MKDFGSRLKQAMEDRDMSAADLSKASGIGRGMISYYLHGKCLAKQDKIYLLARALHVDPGWLMTGEEQEHEQLPDAPRTVEAKILASGIDQMPPEQREAIMKMMMGLYPGVFEKGMVQDDDQF